MKKGRYVYDDDDEDEDDIEEEDEDSVYGSDGEENEQDSNFDDDSVYASDLIDIEKGIAELTKTSYEKYSTLMGDLKRALSFVEANHEVQMKKFLSRFLMSFAVAIKTSLQLIAMKTEDCWHVSFELLQGLSTLLHYGDYQTRKATKRLAQNSSTLKEDLGKLLLKSESKKTKQKPASEEGVANDEDFKLKTHQLVQALYREI